MKKKFLIGTMALIAAVFAAIGLAACEKGGDGPHEEPPKEGVTWTGVDNITIARGDRFDLLEGVTAVDGIEGDITDSVMVTDDGNFDTEYPGRYVIAYEAMTQKGTVYTTSRTISVQVAHNVANGQFNMTTKNWQFDVPGGNGSAKIVDEEQHFTITNPGNQWWSIQFYQLNVYFTFGETYRLSFDAKSPQGHSISGGFEEVNNNNRMMQGGVKVMKLTEEWQHYEMTYTSDADVMNTKVVLYLGWQLPGDETATVSNPHEVIVDNIYVEKLNVAEDAPEFDGVQSVKVISGNHSFDPEQGVTCTDADGNAVDYTVSGVVPLYALKECTYLVQYTAKDAAGRERAVLKSVVVTLATEFPYETVNGDFSQGFTGWTPEINQVQGSGKAEYSEDRENGTVSIKITDPSSADHHIQLWQDSPKFKQGETYRVTVVVKASATRKIKLEVTDSNNDYANIATPKIVDLTTEFQTFTLEFTADQDYNYVKVAALLGNVDGNVGANITVTFDTFIIEKV